MGESSAIKLHHAFKAPRDTREPDHPCCIAHDQDLDAAKKPIIAVSQGAKLVYEYKDGASLVKPATALAGYNVKKMVRRLNATKKFWSTNGRAKARVNAFRNLDMSAEPKIRQVICTGIGSFSSYDTKDLVCNSYNQLTELLLFLEILKNKSLVKENFKIYFQDPAFNKLDIAFLEPFGYRVIHNPEAFNLMTEDTLLYAPGNHDDITYHAIRVARPCLFIGNDLTIWGEVNGLPNPDETTQYFDTNISKDQYHVKTFAAMRSRLLLTEFDAGTAGRAYWSMADDIYYIARYCEDDFCLTMA